MKKVTRNVLAIFLGWCLVSACVITFEQNALAQEPVGEELRIGVIGTMSGPAASWGLVTKYTTITQAEMWNKEGGLLVDGVRHPIKLFFEDDKLDLKLARLAAEKMVHQNKVRFLIGPLSDPTISAAQVVTDPAKIIGFHYGFSKELYGPKHPYSFFGMIASYQSAPLIYKYIMDTYGVKTISMVSENDAFWIYLKDREVEVAKESGLQVLVSDALWEKGTTDYSPIMSKAMVGNPDAIDLTVAGAGATAQMVKTLRQLGYKGVIMHVVAGDEKVFNEIGGKYMDGFLCVGGATTAESRTKEMEKFMEKYIKVAGEWNDEVATKLYTMEMLRATIQTAGAKALTDSDAFLEAVPKVAYKNPYIKGNPTIKFLNYGGLPRQIGVPVVIVQMDGGKFKVVKIAYLED
jgi:branched-chain amino acid transport system substrate-binding protein